MHSPLGEIVLRRDCGARGEAAHQLPRLATMSNEATIYVFNPDDSSPVVVLSVSFSF